MISALVRWTRPTDLAQSGDNGLNRTAKESNHGCTTTCVERVVTLDGQSQPKDRTTTQVRNPSTGSTGPPEPRAPSRAGSSHRILPPRRSPGPPPPGGGPESRTISSCPLRPPPGRQCLEYSIKPQACRGSKEQSGDIGLNGSAKASNHSNTNT